jgi:hypothetical protein
MIKLCPKCGEKGTFHLMMYECDKCINSKPRQPDKYIELNGLLIPNPELKNDSFKI